MLNNLTSGNAVAPSSGLVPEQPTAATPQTSSHRDLSTTATVDIENDPGSVNTGPVQPSTPNLALTPEHSTASQGEDHAAADAAPTAALHLQQAQAQAPNPVPAAAANPAPHPVPLQPAPGHQPAALAATIPSALTRAAILAPPSIGLTSGSNTINLHQHGIDPKSVEGLQATGSANAGGAALGLFSGLVNAATRMYALHRNQETQKATEAAAQLAHRSMYHKMLYGHGNTDFAGATKWLAHDRATQEIRQATNAKTILHQGASVVRDWLQGSVTTATAVGQINAQAVAASFLTTVAPGLGIATGAVGMGLAVKGGWDEYQAGKARNAKALTLRQAEAMVSHPLTPGPLMNAIHNVCTHAQLQINTDRSAGRWGLANHVLKGLAGATSVVGNALVLTGLGAPAGLAIAGISVGLGLASAACSVRQLGYAGARSVKEAAEKDAVRNGSANPQTNRMQALTDLAAGLAAGGISRTQATQFLRTAGMPPLKAEAIATLCQNGPITVDHPAVAELQRFFGL